MNSTEKQTLDFKPLSEGLGFHPFSNGLPYTPTTQPASKRDLTRGTGATAAGHPSFAFPAPVSAKISPAASSPIVAKSAPLQPDLGWDYLAKRLLAYFVDCVINTGLGGTALIGSLWKEDMSPGFFFSGSSLALTAGFLLFFSWALTTAQEVAFGTSLGKKLFGLHLDGSAAATLVRALFFIPSAVFLGLGVFWALFDADRRAFHDRVSGIQPEEN